MAKLKTDNREIEINNEEPITGACEEFGVPFGCYAGTCGACKIEVVEGSENLSELTDEEKEMGMDKRNRLACQCRIKSGDVKIRF